MTSAAREPRLGGGRAGDTLQRLAVYHGAPATTRVPTIRKVRASEAPANCRGRDIQNYAAV